MGFDVKGGKVVVEGWVEEIDLMMFEMVKCFEGVGVVVIIFIDIDWDGVMIGFNIEVIVNFVNVIFIFVVVSGGVLFLGDVKDFVVVNCLGIEGVIFGCVIYDGCLDVKEVFVVFGKVKC